MIDFLKYQDALKYIKRYFENDLKQLNIKSAQIYGSSTYQGGFIEGVSDIDIVIFTPKMKTKNCITYKEIANYIMKSTTIGFIDKPPSVVMDYIGDRIEFYINHPQIALDITVMAPEIPNIDTMEESVAHDAVDVLIGAFFQNGISLIGEMPQKQLIEEQFLPFYSEELRQKRLDMLLPRITKYNERVRKSIITKNMDLFDHIRKARYYFLKWLFIYKRKYPVNLEKHLSWQLSEILLLPEEVEMLQLIGNGNLFKLASNYLEISNNYLNKYIGV